VGAKTFTGPTQGKLIAADPTFEAILECSQANGAEAVKVPLTSGFSMICQNGSRGERLYKLSV
jgi:hypothetical protein